MRYNPNHDPDDDIIPTPPEIKNRLLAMGFNESLEGEISPNNTAKEKYRFEITTGRWDRETDYHIVVTMREDGTMRAEIIKEGEKGEEKASMQSSPEFVLKKIEEVVVALKDKAEKTKKSPPKWFNKKQKGNVKFKPHYVDIEPPKTKSSDLKNSPRLPDFLEASEPKKKTNFVDPELKKRLAGLYGYMSKRLGIKGAPKIYLTHNSGNAKKPFGLTGYYNPDAKAIKIYTTNRHPTDILRSFAHEMIHHWQNEKGTLTSANKNEGHEHYAQKDPNLRKREMEAYLLGNIVFRDWQDEQRYGPLTSLNENLEVTDPKKLQEILKQTLKDLIRMQIIRSIHRQATSGDMNPEDFIEEMARKLELELNKFIQVTNNKGNWENQQDMIAECKKCGCQFNYVDLPEVGQGYAKCPSCQCNIDQEGNVL